MRIILILLISIMSLSAYGQIKELNRKPAKVSINSKKRKKPKVDTIPKVIYKDIDVPNRKPAFFINGKQSNVTILNSINPELIKSIDIEKKEIEIDGISYYGQIYIKMKRDYKPKLISLNDLKLKYISLNANPSIFIIDNVIVKSDYNKYNIDEKCIFKIEVETIKNKDENLQVNIIRLSSKTRGNINKSNEIRIRGIMDEVINN